MEIKFFAFSVKAFYFPKFHKSEAKHEKRKFKRGLTMTFEVKPS